MRSVNDVRSVDDIRVDPYSKDNFMLSHLGFWTDNGAYYYGANHPGFNNSEQALKAVKADFAAREIPVRYFQWDDWWMMSDGDTPGMTSWTPKPTVFPSGFADWLDVPISMVGRNPLSNRKSARENTGGAPRPRQCSLGAADCCLPFMLTRAVLLP